jgi:hypothetical protein
MNQLFAARCTDVDLLAVVLVDDVGREKLLKVCSRVDARGDVGVNMPSFLQIAWVPSLVVEAAIGRSLAGTDLASQFVLLEVESPETVFAGLQGHDQSGTDTEMIVHAISRIYFEMDPSEDAATVRTPRFPKPSATCS